MLDALVTRGFVVKYACQDKLYGYIPSFKTHQVINNKERESVLPAFDEKCVTEPANEDFDPEGTREPRDDDASRKELRGKEGKGRERNGKEGDSSITLALSLEERKEIFKEKVFAFRDGYSEELIKKFIRYWTEHGETDKKMRFEKEKSWSIKARLETFLENEIKWSKDKKQNNATSKNNESGKFTVDNVQSAFAKLSTMYSDGSDS